MNNNHKHHQNEHSRHSSEHHESNEHQLHHQDEDEHEHHHHHNEHQHRSHGMHNGEQNHSSHHGHMVEEFKKRFYISLIVTIPILIISPMIQMFMGVNWRFPGDTYVLFLLSTFVFFYGGWPFIKGAKDELSTKNPGMMTLICLAIVVAYVYSTSSTFGFTKTDFFWELATLIDIMLLGHWIEMKSIMGASKALEELAKLMPSDAHLIKENGEIIEIDVTELKKGDTVLVKPGEKVPIDGQITEGETMIDESMLTGESLPISKQVGDQVIGGSINGQGSVMISVQSVGKETYLSQVITLVQEAQASKSRAQDLANRAAKWLFYGALVVGILTFTAWIALGYSLSFALERMVTVLIIACPHALGLAAPLVIATSTSLAAKKGLLIRNRTAFEGARNIQAIVFDKTGTLTKGEFGITNIHLENASSDTELLTYAASVETHSEHPIAKGITKAAKEKGIQLKEVTDFKALPGSGLQGFVDGKEIMGVSPVYVKEKRLSFDGERFNQWSQEGKTVIFILIDGQVAGMIAMADMIRDTAKDAVQELKNMGIKSIMLTGDNQKVAQYVGNQLGLDEIFAEVLPHQKSDKIDQIQEKEGLRTAMTGDGVNDAPALAKADLGIAIGTGTDVAIETADVVLIKSNPQDVVNIIKLSRLSYRKMMQNLWWATGYNIVAIPLAAGILLPLGIVLDPAVGAILMSLSTVIVAINAKLLKL
ncbi:heavy metal translocating P-type ATPase [Paenibacillus vini]|uniref:heavy metal translocating P-type ATPase n=1 Tax=Paenibacillus vini TaxID=1476024 RepID=UPI0025B671F6|nr:heavy metal translocating P-type ATPase [Paenibacillus vini]MDN4067598.1 heavy metal translocating P-type ATPase [Paenibacillus vini]